MGMGDDMQASGGMGGGPPPPGPPPPEAGGDNKGPNTIFLSKEALGGKTVKEGQTLTLTVKSVDPETGDAEAAITVGGQDQGYKPDAGGDIDAAFDKAMPPEPEAGGY